MPGRLPLFARLLMWLGMYYVAGIISLAFDDPLSQVPVVWLPSGIAVAAFLCSQRSRWPALLVALVATRIFLDDTWRHDLASAVVYSCVGLGAAISIAWLVRRFARPHDDLHGILIWLFSTLVVCALEAVILGSWLMVARDVPLSKLFWVIWVANVTGIVFATIAVMSLLNVELNFRQSGLMAKVVGLVALALLCLSAWWVFRATPGQLIMATSHDTGTALDFALACIPIVFAVIVSVMWGGRGATLALLALAALVIHYTDMGQGPFFLKGLNRDEPLLLAQCYLCATALLMVFLRVLARSARRYDINTGRLSGQGVMYRLHPASGQIAWDDNLQQVLGIEARALSTVSRVLDCVHPQDRDKLRRHWSPSQRRAGGASLTFRITGTGDRTRYVCDQAPGLLTDASGEVIVGNWQISHYR